jgi:hypothetical protein
MSRPTLEVADIVRHHASEWVQHRRLDSGQARVLNAIQRCRTRELGGHRDQCSKADCSYRAISYNSCRNRHCPKCQTRARDRWVADRTGELLPTRYVHVVFTVPRPIARLAYQNKRVVYDLLFQSSAATLLEIARDRKHLGARIGILSVLHTWTQTLQHHPHIHCVVPAGGLSADHTRWIRARHRFFLPVNVLGEVFRGKFLKQLRRAFQRGELRFYGDLALLNDPKRFRAFIGPLHNVDWVVYSKRPFGGPKHVLHYLARYTHRVAISNHRLVSLTDGQVTFRWRDRKHGYAFRTMTLPAEEFLRRFLLHTLPRRFVRIRFFGFLSARQRGRLLPLCRHWLAPSTATETVKPSAEACPNTWRCPECGSPMNIIERFTALQILRLERRGWDSS